MSALVLAVSMLLGAGAAAASDPDSQIQGDGTDNCIYSVALGC